MKKLKYFLHPIRYIKLLFYKVKLFLEKFLTKILFFLCIRRSKRDYCYCGGELMPFRYHHSYDICRECGCYVNRYPPINLKQLYSSKLYWHIMQKYYGYPSIESRGELYKKDGRLTYWLQLIQRYGPPQGIVVEIGCVPGILLSELCAKGYDAIGVEPDKKTADWMHKKMKVDVRAGLFPGVELPDCNLFLAFDVIEHSPNPNYFMQEVARLLKPGGIAIIQTPIERYGYEPPFGEKFESAFKQFEHLFLFSNKSMEVLAENSGLEIVTSNERLWLHHEICVFRKPLK